MNRDLSKYNTKEAFQNYIDENKIESPKDFNIKDSSLYRKLSRCGFSKKVKYPQKRKVYKKNNWDNINTLDDFQNFILKNNILTSSEFRKKYNTLYQKSIRIGIKKQLVFPNTHFWRNLSEYKTLEDFQKFIDDNEILSPMDFKKYDSPLYRKASTLNMCDKLQYEKRNISLSEIKLLKLFETEHIKYEFQKKFKWLKDKTSLSLDFYLPDYNIAIECQGKQHFVINEYFGGKERFESDVNRDKLKYKLCNDNNIKLIYFVDLTTDNFDDINFEVYFDIIFTDLKKLINFIKKNH